MKQTTNDRAAPMHMYPSKPAMHTRSCNAELARMIDPLAYPQSVFWASLYAGREFGTRDRSIHVAIVKTSIKWKNRKTCDVVFLLVMLYPGLECDNDIEFKIKEQSYSKNAPLKSLCTLLVVPMVFNGHLGIPTNRLTHTNGWNFLDVDRSRMCLQQQLKQLWVGKHALRWDGNLGL